MGEAMTSGYKLAAFLLPAALLCACTNIPVAQEDESIRAIYAARDTDRNGCLSRAEWGRAAQNSLAVLEQSSDNSNREMLVASVSEVFDQLDTNGNACIEVDEYLTSSQTTRGKN
jgi:Ca2+-binding EF-hand superfamily protein